MGIRARHVLPVVLAAVVLAGCANFGPDYQLTSDESFQAVERLAIRQGGGGGVGTVRFTAGAPGAVELHRTINRNDVRAPGERVTQEGGTLTIDVDCPPTFGPGQCFIDYDLTVPPGMPTRFDSAGEAEVVGVVGPLMVRAGDVVSVTVAPGSGPYAVTAESTEGGTSIDVPESPSGLPIDVRSQDRIRVETAA
ncbi:hypothetical protein [Pseudonocardia sp. TRM90224]|uniref:hypothetical protein n=1 Tax=Pseudonocardia sp. TRM90224 TaxID=2812678 RepID=UPI001E59C38C|nr:hypothetical protein [Pseudonocardia sp. TRM90224]